MRFDPRHESFANFRIEVDVCKICYEAWTSETETALLTKRTVSILIDISAVENVNNKH
jgi:hypothetical protein